MDFLKLYVTSVKTKAPVVDNQALRHMHLRHMQKYKKARLCMDVGMFIIFILTPQVKIRL